ncbi:MAG TPA: hypothetical protein VMT45_04375 [Thermoanaerobaculaceae bacterium]|nr:hypothetical protein [Thermoanaerobaculaceae bacterium]
MRRALILAGVLCLVVVGIGFAQEHYTEGPVWVVEFYRTTPGHWDDYMQYVRENVLPTNTEAKKQGLILDYKVYLKEPTGPHDWDVAFATLHSGFAKFDYSKGDEDKWKAISAKQYKTEDEKKQREMIEKRFKMRDYLGTSIMREVTLKPIP